MNTKEINQYQRVYSTKNGDLINGMCDVLHFYLPCEIEESLSDAFISLQKRSSFYLDEPYKSALLGQLKRDVRIDMGKYSEDKYQSKDTVFREIYAYMPIGEDSDFPNVFLVLYKR